MNEAKLMQEYHIHINRAQILDRMFTILQKSPFVKSDELNDIRKRVRDIKTAIGELEMIQGVYPFTADALVPFMEADFLHVEEVCGNLSAEWYIIQERIKQISESITGDNAMVERKLEKACVNTLEETIVSLKYLCVKDFWY